MGGRRAVTLLKAAGRVSAEHPDFMADSLATVPRLVASGGRLADVAWNIPDGRSTIGRDRTTAMVVGDDSVSRLRAELSRNGD